MDYSYDNFGCYSLENIQDRQTEIQPPDCAEKVEGKPYPNFTGFEWIMLPYHSKLIAEIEPPGTTDETQKRLSKLEFLNRFTDQELEGIYIAAETSIPVKIWFDKFKLAEYIDLADSLTIAGLSKLEQGGLIALGRPNEILR